MNKSLKIGIVIVVIAVLAGGAAWALTSSNDKSGTESNPEHAHNTTHAHEEDSATPVAATISYNPNGFDPSTVTVKSGDKIRIINNNAQTRLEFSSDPHPSHTDNPELNAGDIDYGSSATITVTKSGEWGFHNHYKSSDHGFLTVE